MMKNLMILSFLLIYALGFSQDTTQIKAREGPELRLSSDEPQTFVYKKGEYSFRPIQDGFTISKRVDGNYEDYGLLRKSTDDGFYILTSKDNDETSFGRFDAHGNFRALRYDVESDSVIESNFTIQNPVERRNRERISRDSIIRKK